MSDSLAARPVLVGITEGSLLCPMLYNIFSCFMPATLSGGDVELALSGPLARLVNRRANEYFDDLLYFVRRRYRLP